MVIRKSALSAPMLCFPAPAAALDEGHMFHPSSQRRRGAQRATNWQARVSGLLLLVPFDGSTQCGTETRELALPKPGVA
jgi:hypothetical protein